KPAAAIPQIPELPGITLDLGNLFPPSYVESLQHDWAADDLIVVSPGVPWDIPGLVRARELGMMTIGEMELAWRHLSMVPWVGITGTNGKTTTTALTAAIFQAAGFCAPACGNIGYAACELALATIEKPVDWVIAELSSYQIEASASITPHIGIWTTFTPDHLNRHKTLENYYGIKARLLKNSQQQVFNGDDPYLYQVGKDQWPHAYWTSVQGTSRLLCTVDRGVYIDSDDWVIAFGQRIVLASALRMKGSHNRQNLLMAIAAARLADIDPVAIAQAVTTFPGVPHRLEHVCTWRGIDFINDSKATNYDAAQVGLSAIASPTILIAGGEAKAGDDSGWLTSIRTYAASVLLIGSAAPTFAQRLADTGYTNYEIVETMDKAVSRAAVLAPQLGVTTVLLSPACASFDQYNNFEQRGDHFRQLCLDLAG
ncbi:MAG: UDP-N-acetylmuramoyl-L-alanine--D-glutamate ligase, partial [Cyanobacteria bacterium]|nr:UDP-N-acetylmuramoyl-L-alanine--D-glutamate ligase [Cyanobacteriota bacterium]MDW8200738.1 UDP-N-acetylmuramoyl-L-alanine--D-glutamate ligase [Cyanobacteriota bacterium SKYGB_h_bin112]